MINDEIIVTGEGQSDTETDNRQSESVGQAQERSALETFLSEFNWDEVKVAAQTVIGFEQGEAAAIVDTLNSAGFDDNDGASVGNRNFRVKYYSDHMGDTGKPVEEFFRALAKDNGKGESFVTEALATKTSAAHPIAFGDYQNGIVRFNVDHPNLLLDGKLDTVLIKSTFVHEAMHLLSADRKGFRTQSDGAFNWDEAFTDFIAEKVSKQMFGDDFAYRTNYYTGGSNARPLRDQFSHFFSEQGIQKIQNAYFSNADALSSWLTSEPDLSDFTEAGREAFNSLSAQQQLTNQAWLDNVVVAYEDPIPKGISSKAEAAANGLSLKATQLNTALAAYGFSGVLTKDALSRVGTIVYGKETREDYEALYKVIDADAETIPKVFRSGELVYVLADGDDLQSANRAWSGNQSKEYMSLALSAVLERQLKTAALPAWIAKSPERLSQLATFLSSKTLSKAGSKLAPKPFISSGVEQQKLTDFESYLREHNLVAFDSDNNIIPESLKSLLSQPEAPAGWDLSTRQTPEAPEGLGDNQGTRTIDPFWTNFDWDQIKQADKETLGLPHTGNKPVIYDNALLKDIENSDSLSDAEKVALSGFDDADSGSSGDRNFRVKYYSTQGHGEHPERNNLLAYQKAFAYDQKLAVDPSNNAPAPAFSGKDGIIRIFVDDPSFYRNGHLDKEFVQSTLAHESVHASSSGRRAFGPFSLETQKANWDEMVTDYLGEKVAKAVFGEDFAFRTNYNNKNAVYNAGLTLRGQLERHYSAEQVNQIVEQYLFDPTAFGQWLNQPSQGNPELSNQKYLENVISEEVDATANHFLKEGNTILNSLPGKIAKVNNVLDAIGLPKITEADLTRQLVVYGVNTKQAFDAVYRVAYPQAGEEASVPSLYTVDNYVYMYAPEGDKVLLWGNNDNVGASDKLITTMVKTAVQKSLSTATNVPDWLKADTASLSQLANLLTAQIVPTFGTKSRFKTVLRRFTLESAESAQYETFKLYLTDNNLVSFNESGQIVPESLTGLLSRAEAPAGWQQSVSVLSAEGEIAYAHNVIDNRDVNTWDAPEVTPRQDGGSSRYDAQVIVQLENDPIVKRAAARLAGKHPDSSVIVQLDADGNPKVVYGDMSILDSDGVDNIRWQLVGHGRAADDDSRTLAGRSAAELAAQLADIKGTLTPGRISLVGCSLASHSQQANFGEQLTQELKWADTEISVRTSELAVDSAGHKHVQDANGDWVHKDSNNKLVLQWDAQNNTVERSSAYDYNGQEFAYESPGDEAVDGVLGPKFKGKGPKLKVEPVAPPPTAAEYLQQNKELLHSKMQDLDNPVFNRAADAPSYETFQAREVAVENGFRLTKTSADVFLHANRVEGLSQGGSAGDKIHISVQEGEVSRAFELIKGLLFSADSPIDSWKVTDMSRTGADSRVKVGTQFTLYIKTDNERKEYSAEGLKKVQTFVSELERTLSEGGITPGVKPSSDVSPSQWQYASYRNELSSDREGGEQQTQALQAQPFYQLITQDPTVLVKDFAQDFARASIEADYFNRFYGEGSAEVYRESDGSVKLRMLKIPGKALDKLTLAELPANAKELYLNMIADLGDAQLYHQDLKLSNVLYDQASNRFWPKDFTGVEDYSDADKLSNFDSAAAQFEQNLIDISRDNTPAGEVLESLGDSNLSTQEKLVLLDKAYGKVAIGGIEIRRERLRRMGAQIDGKLVDADTDFSSPSLQDDLTFDSERLLKQLLNLPDDEAGKNKQALYINLFGDKANTPLSDAALLQLIDNNPGNQSLATIALYLKRQTQAGVYSSTENAEGQPSKAKRFIAYANTLITDLDAPPTNLGSDLRKWVKVQDFAEQTNNYGAWQDDPSVVREIGGLFKRSNGELSLDQTKVDNLSSAQLKTLKVKLDTLTINELRTLDEQKGTLESGISREQLYKAGAIIDGKAVHSQSNFNSQQLVFDGDKFAHAFATADTVGKARYLDLLNRSANQQGMTAESLITGEGALVDSVKLSMAELANSDSWNDGKLKIGAFDDISAGIDTAVAAKSSSLNAAGAAAGNTLSVIDKYGKASGFWSLFKSIGTDDQKGIESSAGGLANTFGSEAIEKLSQKVGARIARSATASLKSIGGRIASGVGKVLGKGAGVIGALASVPFDVYYGIVEPLKGFEDKKGLERQDAIYSITTSAISITAATVFAGLTLVAGPVGAIAGAVFAVVMVGVDAIYSAVRKVQAIEEIIPLTAGQRAEIGTRAFFGDTTPQNIQEDVLQAQYSSKYQELLKSSADNLLAGVSDNFSAVIYEETEVKVQKFAEGYLDIGGTYQDAWEGGEIDHEHIHINTAQYEGGGWTLNSNRQYAEIYADYHNANFDYSAGLGSSDHLKQVGSVQSDKGVLFNLANGNDTGIGLKANANMFMLETGNKNITGGDKQDIFVLNASAPLTGADGRLFDEARATHAALFSSYRYDLDGGDGIDSLQLNTDFSDTDYLGYKVDLTAETIALKHKNGTETNIGTVANMENLLQGIAATDFKSQHHFIGDENNNLLTGKGKDTLEGGAGADSYRIGELENGDKVTIIEAAAQDEIEGNSVEVNDVLLGTQFTDLDNWQIVGNDLIISLKKGGQIQVKDMYELNAQGERVRLNKLLRFSTTDGFMLSAQLPQTISGNGNVDDFKLSTIYNAAMDQQRINGSNQGVEIDLAARSISRKGDGAGLTQLENNQQISYQGSQSKTKYWFDAAAKDISVRMDVDFRFHDSDSIYGHGNQRVVTFNDFKLVFVIDKGNGQKEEVKLDIGSFIEDKSEQWDYDFHERKHSLTLNVEGQEQKAVYDALRFYTNDGYEVNFGTELGNIMRRFEVFSDGGYMDARSPMSTTIYSDLSQAGGLVTTEHTGFSVPKPIVLSERYELAAQGTELNDNIIGDSKDNILVAQGNDTLTGRAGADIYVAASAGITVIDNQDTSTTPENDAIVVDAGMEEIDMWRDEHDLVLRYRNSQGEKVVVQIRNYYQQDSQGNYPNAHLYLVDNEGGSMHFSYDKEKDILVKALVGGDVTEKSAATFQGDILIAGDETNTLIGGNGHDWLQLDANSGKQVDSPLMLRGNAGDDMYDLSQLGEQEVIIDNRDDDRGIDTVAITLDPATGEQGLSFNRDNQDLVVNFQSDTGKAGKFTLADYFLSENYQHIKLVVLNNLPTDDSAGFSGLSAEAFRAKAYAAPLALESQNSISADALLDSITNFHNPFEDVQSTDVTIKIGGAESGELTTTMHISLMAGDRTLNKISLPQALSQGYPSADSIALAINNAMPGGITFADASLRNESLSAFVKGLLNDPSKRTIPNRWFIDGTTAAIAPVDSSAVAWGSEFVQSNSESIAAQGGTVVKVLGNEFSAAKQYRLEVSTEGDITGLSLSLFAGDTLLKTVAQANTLAINPNELSYEQLSAALNQGMRLEISNSGDTEVSLANITLDAKAINAHISYTTSRREIISGQVLDAQAWENMSKKEQDDYIAVGQAANEKPGNGTVFDLGWGAIESNINGVNTYNDNFEGFGNVQGTILDDYIEGAGYETSKNTLDGRAGDDVIRGFAGTNVLIGGTGNDVMDGGAGNTTYHYTKGDGVDVIRDSGGENTLILDGFDTDDIWLTKQQDDSLLIEFGDSQNGADWQNGANGSITVHGNIDEVSLGEHSLSSANINLLVQAMAGSDIGDLDGVSGNGQTVKQQLDTLWMPKAS
ncbi:C80 family cysteine peptidase [Thalassomonas sp. RHCl1]|uniref:C80 family cysteine peptidase n=1 Tax=Thalassomonas sp. RHCl1 TaxID=2995320 RepID=UPI00248B6FED|nr:C80 family cysteine peptidase [Thalassomonas sp. RHCl1]